MGRRVVNKEAVKQSVVRSTKASAKLELRTVPSTFVRSASVERFLVGRRRQN